MNSTHVHLQPWHCISGSRWHWAYLLMCVDVYGMIYLLKWPQVDDFDPVAAVRRLFRFDAYSMA